MGMMTSRRCRPEDQRALERMASDGMHCEEWLVLLDKAEAQWRDFLFVLVQRAPNDDRIKALTASDTVPSGSVLHDQPTSGG